jgi:hypothetical protein
MLANMNAMNQDGSDGYCRATADSAIAASGCPGPEAGEVFHDGIVIERRVRVQDAKPTN